MARPEKAPDVEQAKRSPGVVDDAHRAEVADDVVHRSAGGVHVAHESAQAWFSFVDDDAH
jgi:hypothetical protein